MTKIADIRAKNADELKTLEGELRTELFKARIQNHTNQLDSTAKLRDLKRDIARINTVLRQRELETVTDVKAKS
ncbi:MAG TPA: 50S ribosomal protein L29 [Polyangiales bacterium]